METSAVVAQTEVEVDSIGSDLSCLASLDGFSVDFNGKSHESSRRPPNEGALQGFPCHNLTDNDKYCESKFFKERDNTEGGTVKKARQVLKRRADKHKRV